MANEDIKLLKSGVFKRTTKRQLALFIDGVGLDRATKRISKKVDLARLVQGMGAGRKLEISRYYTLIPYEDDARQFAFLEAVERAGLETVVKRLPPKGVKRQATLDVLMACDLVAYAYGYFDKREPETSDGTAPDVEPVKRSAILVCPTREITYAIHLANQVGVETSLADFGMYASSDGWKGVDKWIDLSTSETIFREDRREEERTK